MRILWWFAPWTAWSTWVCHKKLKGSEMEDGKGPTCHFSVVLGRRRVPADSPIEVERANWGIHRWKCWRQQGGTSVICSLNTSIPHIYDSMQYIYIIYMQYMNSIRPRDTVNFITPVGFRADFEWNPKTHLVFQPPKTAVLGLDAKHEFDWKHTVNPDAIPQKNSVPCQEVLYWNI